MAETSKRNITNCRNLSDQQAASHCRFIISYGLYRDIILSDTGGALRAHYLVKVIEVSYPSIIEIHTQYHHLTSNNWWLKTAK